MPKRGKKSTKTDEISQEIDKELEKDIDLDEIPDLTDVDVEKGIETLKKEMDKEFEEEKQEIEEKPQEPNEDTGGTVCPLCGEKVPYFIRRGRSLNVYCPKCNGRISLAKVDLKYVKQFPPKSKSKKSSSEPEITIEPKISAPEPDDYEGEVIELVDRPKTPEEVLREVLEEYGIPKKFIDFAVKRSQRVGGLHPAELEQMLLMIKFSGVRDKGTASFVASDYAYALKQEEEKAKRMKETYPYPGGLGLGREDDYEYKPYYNVGFRRDDDMFRRKYNRFNRREEEERETKPLPMPITPMPPMTNPWYRSSYNQKSEDDLDKFVKFATAIEKLKGSDKEVSELKMELEKLRMETDSKFKDVLNFVKDQINQVISSIGSGRSKDDLEKVKLEMKLQQLEDKLNSVLKENEMLREEIIRLRTRGGEGGYKEDAYRVLGTAIQEVARVAEKKEPIKHIVRLVASGEEEKEKFKAKKVLKTSSDITDYVDSEYVEGGE